MLSTIINQINSYTGFQCLPIECSESEGNYYIAFTFNNLKYVMEITYPNDPVERLIFIYLLEDQIESYPHIIRINYRDINYRGRSFRYLCLIDKEEYIFSLMTLAEYIDLMLGQLERLMNLNAREIKIEYQKEFLYYWNQAAKKIGNNMLIAEIYLPPEKEACEVDCVSVSGSKFLNKKILIKQHSIFVNPIYAEMGLTETGLLIPITDSTDLIPPTCGKLWDKNTILDIVSNQTKDRISVNDYKYLRKLSVNSLHKIIVFTMMIPTGIEIAFVALLKFKDNKKKLFFDKIREDLVDIIPIYSGRSDIDYMVKRVGGDNLFLNKRVLIIGAGSVGSYLITELAKKGIMNMTIADTDELEPGNILRHRLGKNYVSKNKAQAMKFELERMYPQANISAYQDLFDKRETSKISFFNKFDLIILTVGSSDVQRKYNKFFKQIKLQCSVIYNWLDAEGKGSHVLYVDYAHKGCYDCLFQDNGAYIPHNKVSFTDGSEVLIGEGCGGSFTPYGNEVLLKNTYIALEIIQKALSGELHENILVSCRNNFDSLKTALNLDVTINQDFYEESCDVCGNI